jgi:SH3 domain protein
MMKRLWLCILGIFAISGVAAAAPVYVSDILYITLRTGQGDEFKILKTLKSGTKMELIEKSDDKYAKVRMEDGTEGYVQHRFLLEEPTAELKLASALDKVERLTRENSQLKEKYNKTRSELKDTQKERNKLEKTSSKLAKEQKELESVAAKPIQLDRENKELRTRNAELAKEAEELKRENSALSGESTRDWFLTGAGVIILGILIGLVVPRLRLRKSSSWA